MSLVLKIEWHTMPFWILSCFILTFLIFCWIWLAAKSVKVSWGFNIIEQPALVCFMKRSYFQDLKNCVLCKHLQRRKYFVSHSWREMRSGTKWLFLQIRAHISSSTRVDWIGYHKQKAAQCTCFNAFKDHYCSCRMTCHLGRCCSEPSGGLQE